MARAGYCSHGWNIPTQKAREPFVITLPDGTEKIVPPIIVECPYCVSEKKARRDRAEAQQAYEMNMVKMNLLRLLKEDPHFAERVRVLLNEQHEEAVKLDAGLDNERRCCN